MNPRILSRNLLAVAAVVSAVILVPSPTEAQSRVSVQACKQIIPRQTAYGPEVLTRNCGNRFTTQDAYAALVLELFDLNDSIQIALLSKDPEQTNVWATRTGFTVESETRYSVASISIVLAIASDAAALAKENPQLLNYLIPVRGKPVRERLGEWTYTVTLGNRPPLVLKFTLEAAPGTGSTPTPAPASTPASTPTPAP